MRNVVRSVAEAVVDSTATAVVDSTARIVVERHAVQVGVVVVAHRNGRHGDWDAAVAQEIRREHD